MLANLDKARAAPKEKIYGPSEKRSAANHANLQKAHAARAAARAAKQAFRERFERLFPPFPHGNLESSRAGSQGVAAVSGVSDRGQEAAGIEELREVAERVWQRRRFYPRRARREGRKVMRLLTAAAQRPAPGSMADALQLLRQLLEIFLQSKPVGQAERLNAEIGRLLREMVERRYGVEVFPDNFPLAASMRETEARTGADAGGGEGERAR